MVSSPVASKLSGRVEDLPCSGSQVLRVAVHCQVLGCRKHLAVWLWLCFFAGIQKSRRLRSVLSSPGVNRAAAIELSVNEDLRRLVRRAGAPHGNVEAQVKLAAVDERRRAYVSRDDPLALVRRRFLCQLYQALPAISDPDTLAARAPTRAHNPAIAHATCCLLLAGRRVRLPPVPCAQQGDTLIRDDVLLWQPGRPSSAECVAQQHFLNEQL